MTKNELAKLIDHTILKAIATQEDVTKLCNEALEYEFASVCINPSFVPLAANLLKDSSVLVCTVIGFPLGSTSTAAKAFEAQEAVKNGALEVDMVINVGALKERREDVVFQDISAVVEAAKGANPEAITKVIIETCYLTDEEKVLACQLAKKAGAHFVKTSTGFGSGGATAHDISLMRQTVGPEMGVKASGGIKNLEQVLEMVKAGASRIGASAGVDIVKELAL
ncbi:deoxyribose-phosphate aldolase [Desulfosporosinus sp. Sb-LF]|uniref:deoxyribose-phosphate aldolase n=1 Tax=Desulfosporosinus sp. Sb-LF TaxID=2560027 RepID=UPI00107F908D|nr:deoxyribose-phosphate aldolase [Desulfosporosinus sp. Sb-LF]TGE31735.1 deoxyribose-phosphate aldolase [Desulfosporosinus sp. Sb-LF]